MSRQVHERRQIPDVSGLSHLRLGGVSQLARLRLELPQAVPMPNRERRGRSCTMFSLLTMLSISLSGCTLIGAGVGADIDSMIPGPYEEHPPTELMQLESNERVVVRLRNGACVSG